MAESRAKKDAAADIGTAEFSDSDDSSSMEKFRHMITRPDWLQVFKKKCEDEKLEELKKKSSETELLPCETVLSSPSPVLPEPVKLNQRRKGRKGCQSLNTEKPTTECVPLPLAELISVPVAQRKQRRKTPTNVTVSVSLSVPGRQKRTLRSAVNTTESVSLPVQGGQKRTRRSAVKATESVSHPPQGRQKRTRQDAVHQAARGRKGRTKSKRHANKSSAHENRDFDIVFLSDSESEIRTVQTSEVQNRISVATATGLDDSIEVISVSSHKDLDFEEIGDQDMEVKVFFCWRNKLLKLPMKQNTQFGTILSTLCSSWEVQGSDIMLLYHDKIIKVDDTPSTYEMLTGSIVDCSVVKSKISVDASDPNVITIRVQTKTSRDKKLMAVHQMAPFQTIIEQFAKEEGIPAEKVVFKFDGDKVSPSDTPYGLGIEDNYSIDVTY